MPDAPAITEPIPPASRPPFFRRPVAGWLLGGALTLLVSGLALMMFVRLQRASEDLRDTHREIARVQSSLGAAHTRTQSLETQMSILRRQLRSCERAESLSVRLWNKHVEEMDANLNSSRAEYERLFAEAEALRKRANRAGRAC